MIRILFIFSVIVLLTAPSYAQEAQYDIEWGDKHKLTAGVFSDNRTIGIFDDHYYLLSSNRTKSNLLKFDLNHNLVSTIDVTQKYKGKKLTFSDFVHTKAGTYACLPQMEKDKWRLVISKFNGKDFDDNKELLSHDYAAPKISLLANNLMGMSWTAPSLLVTSTNKDYVGYFNQVDSRNIKTDAVVAVFDAEMELKWERKCMLSDDSKMVFPIQTIVDNEGVLYLLCASYAVGTVKKSNKDKRRVLERPAYSIYRITANDIREFEINLEEQFLPIAIRMFSPDENETKMVVAGFYSEQQTEVSIKGVFYIARDQKDAALDDVVISEFDESFLSGLSIRSKKGKVLHNPSRYKVSDFIQYSDGSIGFIAEEHYVSTTTSTTRTTNGRTNSQSVNSSTKTTYISNNLIIPRLSKYGDLIDVQKIDKQFARQQPIYISYSMAFFDDTIYLVFNDRKTLKEIKTLKKGILQDFTDLAVIFPDGKVHRETLFSSKEIKLDFVPDLSAYTDGVFILGANGAYKYAFGKVVLKK